MNQDSFIKELGRSYIVSSLLPATFFCLITLVLFQDFLPIQNLQEVKQVNIVELSQWMLFSITPIWIAFFLFSSVDWVVKLYEGYFIWKPLEKILKLRQQYRIKKATRKFRVIKDILDKDIEDRSYIDEQTYKRNRQAAVEELRGLELDSPVNNDYIMPTRLGNILKSSEVYAQERYKIEPINIWPRLFAVLPEQFLKDMEEKNNHFMFLLNSSFLSCVVGSLSLLTGLAGYYVRNNSIAWLDRILLQEGPSLPNLLGQSPFIFVLWAVFLFIAGYLLYSVAINAAYDFALFYRAGFDLYRIDLIKQLRQKIPVDIDEEKNMWNRISEFLAAGDRILWDKTLMPLPEYYFYKPDEKLPEKDTIPSPAFSLRSIWSIFTK